MSKHKQLFKIVILGDSNVGKTCLLQQFVNKQFSMSYKATVGADFLSKQVTFDDETVTLQIWDTAGQQRYQSLGGAFYKGSDCCVLVFDLTDMKSFRNLDKWRDMFFEHCKVPSKQDFPFVILANKADLRQSREVTQSEARQWQKKGINIAYYQTSAKDGVNVQKAFQTVGRFAFNSCSLQPKLIPQSVTLHKKIPKTKDTGCSC